MAAITKKVYPLGGGDYTSVASALSLIAHNDGDDLTLLTGPGNLGGASFTSLTYNSVTVKADTGYKHDGTTNSATSSVSSVTTGSWSTDNTGPATVTVDGIFFNRNANPLFEVYNDGTGGIPTVNIYNCVVKYGAGNANVILADPDGGVVNLTIENTPFYMNPGGSGTTAIHAAPTSLNSTATVNLVLYFNSGANTGTKANLVAFVHADCSNDGGGGGSVVNVTCRDNAFCNAASDFKRTPAACVINVVDSGNNVSADTTANVFVGSGNLTGRSAATCFKTPASDLHPASGSPLLAAGSAVVGITTDNQGVLRPNPPAIGALDVAAVSRSRASAGDFGILGNGD